MQNNLQRVQAERGKEMRKQMCLSNIITMAEAKPSFVDDEEVRILALAYRKIQKRLRAANRKIKAMKAEHD
jgi:predicted DsbA family dithiol-disulfide isomerase